MADQIQTVPMVNPETGKTADVHPAEVDNWTRWGWRLAAKAENEETANAAYVLALVDKEPFMSFRAHAMKVLGDDCPPTKDEIVAALKAKAAPPDEPPPKPPQ